MKTTPKRRARKPKDITTEIVDTTIDFFGDGGRCGISVISGPMVSEEARKLSKHLIQFADWAESKEKK